MRIAPASSIIAALADIDAVVSDIPDSKLRESTGILLRVSLDIWRTFSESVSKAHEAASLVNSSVVRRLGSRSVFLVPDATEMCSTAFAESGEIESAPLQVIVDGNGSANLASVSSEIAAELCHADLADLFNSARSRCVLRASENHHFALPSGAHASQFIRLAELFSDIRSLDIVAYWISIRIRKVDIKSKMRRTLIVDNPSMIGLASRLQTICRGNFRIACLPSYPVTIFEKDETLEFLASIGSNADEVDVVISVASTGAMYALIDKWRGESSKLGASLIVYSTRPSIASCVLCEVDLPDYQHYLAGENCILCERSKAVQIHSSTYFYAIEPAAPVALPARYFEEQASFISKYGAEPGVLRVHFDEPNEAGKRHHSFYVDVRSLLKVPAFLQDLEQHLACIDTHPHAVLSPKHEAGMALGAIASAYFGAPHFAHNSLRLEKGCDEDSQIIEAVGRSTTVLIVDDLYITGKRFSDFNRALREQPAIFGHIKRVMFLCVAAITNSDESLTKQKNGLTVNHGWNATWSSMFKLHLPRWFSNAECSWCKEGGHLLRLAQRANDFDSPHVNRLARLQNLNDGLGNNWCEALDVDGNIPTLGAESALGLPAGAQPIQVLFACASAVQQLRVARDKSLNVDAFPAPRLLAKRVFSDNYSERLIWICLLRVVSSVEMESDLKAFLRSVALDIESDKTSKYMRRELAISSLAGHLGGAQSKELEQFMESVSLLTE